MNDWMKKNVVTLLMITGGWLFTVATVKAQTEWRLDSLEADVAEIQRIVHRLELTAIKLETVSDRLERMTRQ